MASVFLSVFLWGRKSGLDAYDHCALARTDPPIKFGEPQMTFTKPHVCGLACIHRAIESLQPRLPSFQGTTQVRRWESPPEETALRRTQSCPCFQLRVFTHTSRSKQLIWIEASIHKELNLPHKCPVSCTHGDTRTGKTPMLG